MFTVIVSKFTEMKGNLKKKKVSQRENIWDHSVKIWKSVNVSHYQLCGVSYVCLDSFMSCLSFYPGPDEMLFLNN